MASSLPTDAMIDLESVRKHVECPICMEIPRDGIILQCKNGHNVCISCKDKLEDPQCPQGRCDYHDPPTRNRTVADLITSLPFEFQCKHFTSGCVFKGTITVIKGHEIICEHRPVLCPDSLCVEYISADRVIDHLTKVHNVQVRTKPWFTHEPDVVRIFYPWQQDFNSSLKIFDRISGLHEVNAGWMLPGAHFQSGQIWLWLQMCAPSSVTDCLKCRITLSNSNADYSMSFMAPVYPIDWYREKIMEDEGCICLSSWSIQKMLTRGTTENEREFRVKFKVIKTSA